MLSNTSMVYNQSNIKNPIAGYNSTTGMNINTSFKKISPNETENKDKSGMINYNKLFNIF